MGKKIIPLNQSKVGIIGENILINGNKATAYYIMPLYNYRVMSELAINSHISTLQSAFLSLESAYSNVTCSIYKTSVISTSKQKVERLIRTCQGWDRFYDVPEIFRKNIKDESNQFAILAVDIDRSNVADVESMSPTDIVKHYYSQAVASFANMNNIAVYSNHILEVEESIKKILSRYVTRVSREMLLNIYLRNVFPSYDINIDSHIAKNDIAICTAIHQDFIPHFGYFEMSNAGVEILGTKRVTTYGSLINILEFPDQINSDNMNLDIRGMRTIFQVLKKNQAKLQLKRARADIEYEQESAEVAGARDLDLDEYEDLCERALAGLNADRMLCNMNTYILLLDTDLDSLKNAKQNLLTSLRDIDIIAAVAKDQCKEYINNFIRLSVDKNEWNHLTELRFPLSFQIDSGLSCGDWDSKYEAPNIGNDQVEIDY